MDPILTDKISPEQSIARLLLGSNIAMSDPQCFKLNQYVYMRSWSVTPAAGQKLPAGQFGKIVCHKISEGEYAVQLLYWKKQATSSASHLVCALYFDPAFLSFWDEQSIIEEDVFNENTSGLQFNFCNESQQAVNELLAFAPERSFSDKLRQLELVSLLLRKSILHINASSNTYSVPACGFLNNNSERDKVIQAHMIISKEFEQVLTIKDLSKRVAINECYLKKGFKAMFGKTINEYQQHLRIEKAKELLQTDGYSVSDVANALGYSSISHFSTAFKKATSMKPCELLK